MAARAINEDNPLGNLKVKGDLLNHMRDVRK